MADKRIFEPASITSLDFDRTEVDMGAGSGLPGGGDPSIIVPPTTPTPNYSLEFVEFDTGSFSMFEFKVPSLPKEFTRIELTLCFLPGELHNTLYSAQLLKGSEKEYVNFVSTDGSGGSTVKVSMTVGYPGANDPNTPPSDREVTLKIKTLWNHDYIDDPNYIHAGKATLGGYDGIRTIDGTTRDVRKYTSNIYASFY